MFSDAGYIFEAKDVTDWYTGLMALAKGSFCFLFIMVFWPFVFLLVTAVVFLWVQMDSNIGSAEEYEHNE